MLMHKNLHRCCKCSEHKSTSCGASHTNSRGGTLRCNKFILGRDSKQRTEYIQKERLSIRVLQVHLNYLVCAMPPYAQNDFGGAILEKRAQTRQHSFIHVGTMIPTAKKKTPWTTFVDLKDNGQATFCVLKTCSGISKSPKLPLILHQILNSSFLLCVACKTSATWGIEPPFQSSRVDMTVYIYRTMPTLLTWCRIANKNHNQARRGILPFSFAANTCAFCAVMPNPGGELLSSIGSMPSQSWSTFERISGQDGKRCAIKKVSFLRFLFCNVNTMVARPYRSTPSYLISVVPRMLATP